MTDSSPAPAAPAGAPRHLQLTVADVIAETPDAVSLVFAEPETGSGSGPLAYLPGQFLTLRIPSEQTGSVARCYSLASGPGQPPSVVIKRTVDGYASNWLCDNVRPGDVIESLAPTGAFTPARMDVPLLLLAGGSGITPIMSILRTALAADTTPGADPAPITLFYANRSASDTIFAAALAELAAQHPDRLTIVWWQADTRGLPDADMLAALLTPYHSRPSYLCGPEGFMAAAKEALTVIGTPRNLVHQEVFHSLTGDPFAEIAGIDATERTDDDPVVAVSNLGAPAELAWPTGRTLLEVLLDAGYDAPYSCQEGECGSCICKLTEGTVDMASSYALEPEDIEDGYILGCQARPTSTRLAVEF